MGLIWALIVGGVIGAVAGAILNKGNSMGIIANVVAGLVGASVGQAILGEWGPSLAGMAFNTQGDERQGSGRGEVLSAGHGRPCRGRRRKPQDAGVPAVRSAGNGARQGRPFPEIQGWRRHRRQDICHG